MAIYIIFGIDFLMFLKIRNTQSKQLLICDIKKIEEVKDIKSEQVKPEIKQAEKTIENKEEKKESNDKPNEITRPDKEEKQTSEHVSNKEIVKPVDVKSVASIPVYKKKKLDVVSVELPVYVSNRQKHIEKDVVKEQYNEKISIPVEEDKQEDIEQENIEEEIEKIMSDTTTTESEKK
jgi:hypothetical protein